MAEQKIVWSVLPNNYNDENSSLCLSVCVSPQLIFDIPQSSNITDQNFRDFKDWPSTAKDIIFEFEFFSSDPAMPDHPVPYNPTAKFAAQPMPRILLDKNGDEANSLLWKCIFHEFVKFLPYDDQLPLTELATFPLEILRGIIRPYQSLNTLSRLTFPRLDSDEFSFLQVPEVGSKEFFNTNLSDSCSLPQTIALMQNFHKALTNSDKNTAFIEDIEDPFDFHRIITLLGNYPAVSRYLQLIFDFELSQYTFPQLLDIGDTGFVNVYATFTSKNPSEVTYTPLSPKTKYRLNRDKKLFCAAPRNEATWEVEEGLIRLKDNYEIEQWDMEAAAIKLMNMNTQDPTDDQDGLPAIKSNGLTLIQKNRSAKILNRINTKEQDRISDVVFAENLIRGVRPDIWYNGKWSSLCERSSIYSVLLPSGECLSFGSETHEFRDEGFIQNLVMQSFSSDPSQGFIHGSVFTWTGWNFVERPGKSTNTGNQTITDDYKTLSLKAKYSVKPGTVTPLRFWDASFNTTPQYQIRLRVVDQAGNSISAAHADKLTRDNTDYILPLEKYLRFEPVNAPYVYMTEQSAERKVLGETVNRIVILTDNSNESEDTDKSSDSSVRYISPPQLSVRDAEVLGMLDKNGRVRSDKKTYCLLKAGDEYRYEEQLIIKEPESDICEDEDLSRNLPYIPDALACGATFVNLPGLPEGHQWTGNDESQQQEHLEEATLAKIAFGHQNVSDWESAKPFRFKLVEGTAKPEWDDDCLVVYLPKAQVRTVQLSSFLRQEDIERMGHVESFFRIKPDTIETEQHKMAMKHLTDGRHWVISPERSLTLVHAVKQPLGFPEIVELEPHREEGETIVTFRGEIEFHAGSTAVLDFNGSLSSEEDDRKFPTISRLPIHHSEDSVISVNRISVGLLELSGSQAQRDKIIFNGPGNSPIQNFGDTKYRKMDYEVTAISRFREYFPTGKDEEFIRASRKRFTVVIPSSARPKPLDLDHLCPLHAYINNQDRRKGDDYKSRSKGIGFKIYFNDDWGGTGEGELLAVVLPDPDLNGHQRSASLLSSDSIHNKAKLTPLKLEHFKERLIEYDSKSYKLPEDIQSDYRIAAHNFIKDNSGKSHTYLIIDLPDNEIEAKPFLKFGLARFQPNSLKDLELSQIVPVLYAQLSPSRYITIVNRDKLQFPNPPDKPYRFDITISGSSWPEKEDYEIEIEVEIMIDDRDDKLSWIPLKNGYTVKRNSDSNEVWSGTVTIDRIRKPDRYRIVIQEYECFYNGTDKFRKLSFVECMLI